MAAVDLIGAVGPLLLADDVPGAGRALLDPNGVVAALAYAGVGVAVFAVAFWVMAKVVPFSVRKEIEEDQNTALGVIMGSVVIGLAIIIAAAIHGG